MPRVEDPNFMQADSQIDPEDLAYAMRAKRATQSIPEDPWKHRDATMRCSTCMWFVVKQRLSSTLGTPVREIGRCRRHAPTMNGYPVVFNHDWCGDHKLDENKQ